MPPRKSPTTLTPREARFASEYIVDYNGTQAAIRAGYSPRSAQVTATEILSRPIVQKELERQKALQSERTNVSADMVLRELGKIATSNPGRYIMVGDDGQLHPNFSLMTPDDFASVSAIEFNTVKEGPRRRRKGGRKGPSGPAGAHASLPRQVVSKIKHWDKGAALMALGRHFNLLDPDVPPPPPPDAGRRATVVNILIQNLNKQAGRVAIQVSEDGQVTSPRPNGPANGTGLAMSAKPNGKGNGHG